jgi:hypothetical protein
MTSTTSIKNIPVTSLTQAQSSLDEISDKMPEGVYLTLSGLLGKAFKETTDKVDSTPRARNRVVDSSREPITFRATTQVSNYRNPAHYDPPLSTERRVELTRKGRCVPGENCTVIRITRNTQFDKLWHQRTGLIFESFKDRKVIGRVFNGVIHDLTSDDIEICKGWGWRYVE